MDFLQPYINNQIIYNYIPAITVFILTLITIKITKSFITLKIKRFSKITKSNIDDLIVDLLKTFNFPFYIILSLLLSVRFVNLGSKIDFYINNLTFIVVTIYAVMSLKVILSYVIDEYISKDIRATNTFKSILNIILWVIGFAVILQNLGYNISTLVAGLGIGGIAIAFAIQNILSDIFSSFSIYLDKPFNEGDFIEVGADSGTVKKIGVKSTRIITLQGEELIISNQELTTARVRNYKKMKERRVLFNVGIQYETPLNKVQKVKQIITQVITDQDNARVDRVNLSQLASDNINFEIVYYVDSQDYYLYKNVHESINLKIMQEFSKNKIDFAYPTQKIFIDK